jgi:molybdenum cofactor cytidylyltransferase
MRVAALLLAAGASRRLGRPKQLAELEGVPLVRRAAQAALGAGASPVAVVLGAEADAVGAVLADLDVVPVLNPAFEEGLASSIRSGLAGLAAGAPACDGVLLLLADQPRADAPALRRLLAGFEEAEGRRIVASAYAGVLGTPAVFPRARFAELAALRGERGARSVIEARRAEVVAVPLPGGELDVDTPEDLERARRDADRRLG